MIGRIKDGVDLQHDVYDDGEVDRDVRVPLEVRRHEGEGHAPREVIREVELRHRRVSARAEARRLPRRMVPYGGLATRDFGRCGVARRLTRPAGGGPDQDEDVHHVVVPPQLGLRVTHPAVAAAQKRERC